MTQPADKDDSLTIAYLKGVYDERDRTAALLADVREALDNMIAATHPETSDGKYHAAKRAIQRVDEHLNIKDRP